MNRRGNTRQLGFEIGQYCLVLIFYKIVERERERERERETLGYYFILLVYLIFGIKIIVFIFFRLFN